MTHLSTSILAIEGRRSRHPHSGPICSRRGGRLSPDAVARLVAKHTATAAATCASLRTKNVTPHTLRHTAAMSLLHAGADTSVIALWLGHESQETSMISSLERRFLASAGGVGSYSPEMTWNDATGKNCVVTIRTEPGPAVPMTAELYRADDPDLLSTDKGLYTTYAGPVYLAARGHCVTWRGYCPNRQHLPRRGVRHSPTA